MIDPCSQCGIPYMQVGRVGVGVGGVGGGVGLYTLYNYIRKCRVCYPAHFDVYYAIT